MAPPVCRELHGEVQTNKSRAAVHFLAELCEPIVSQHGMLAGAVAVEKDRVRRCQFGCDRPIFHNVPVGYLSDL